MKDTSWMSSQGMSSILFIVIAVVYFLIGTVGSIIVGKLGSGNLNGAYFYSTKVDEMIFGKSIKQLNAEHPEWGNYMTTMMLAFCSFMIALGLVQFGVARFSLIHKEWWAFIVLVISNLIILFFYWTFLIIPVLRTYKVGYFELWHPYAFAPTLLLIPAIILGWIGLKH